MSLGLFNQTPSSLKQRHNVSDVAGKPQGLLPSTHSRSACMGRTVVPQRTQQQYMQQSEFSLYKSELPPSRPVENKGKTKANAAAALGTAAGGMDLLSRRTRASNEFTAVTNHNPVSYMNVQKGVESVQSEEVGSDSVNAFTDVLTDPFEKMWSEQRDSHLELMNNYSKLLEQHEELVNEYKELLEENLGLKEEVSELKSKVKALTLTLERGRGAEKS